MQNLQSPGSPNDMLWRAAREEVRKSHPTLLNEFEDQIQKQVQPSGDTAPITSIIEQRLDEAREEYRRNQQGHVKSSGGRILFSNVVERILGYFKHYKEFGSAVSSLDPLNAASFSWAGIQLFVTASLDNRVMREVVLDDQHYIAHVINCCFEVTRAYLPPDSQIPPSTRSTMENDILKLYIAILEYQIQGWKYLNEPEIVSGHAALARSEQRSIKCLVDQIRAEFKKLRDCQENARGHVLRAVEQETANQIQTLYGIETKVKDVESSLAHMGQDLCQSEIDQN
ncbi:hypothetical protein BBP40_012263 [Aspergillus hancockii]|nr:hypothetical protein BBP40_012263 [Aspergillus hancockii]